MVNSTVQRTLSAIISSGTCASVLGKVALDHDMQTIGIHELQDKSSFNSLNSSLSINRKEDLCSLCSLCVYFIWICPAGPVQHFFWYYRRKLAVPEWPTIPSSHEYYLKFSVQQSMYGRKQNLFYRLQLQHQSSHFRVPLVFNNTHQRPVNDTKLKTALHMTQSH